MSVKHLLITIDEDKADYSGGIPLEAPAMEVVLCRDCKHHYTRNVVSWRGEIFDTDHFCSWGERREDA